MTEQKGNIQATFKINKVSTLSYEELKPDNLELKTEILEFTYEISLGIKVNPELKLVDILVNINIFLDSEKKHKIGKIETSSVYEIINFDEVVKLRENELSIPDNILIIFISVSISTTRGILITKAANGFLKNAIIPVLNPKEFLPTIPLQSK